MMKKILHSILFTLSIFASNAYAVDMAVLQEQCADIGFKIRTPANGKCVLRLMKGVNATEAREASEERARADSVRAREEESLVRDAEIAQARAVRQQQEAQQAELMELQRRSVAAQEEAASAQSRNSSINSLSNTIQMLGGTGAYYKPPVYAPAPAIKTPISCFTGGGGRWTTCQ
jgi:hypothetical protein